MTGRHDGSHQPTLLLGGFDETAVQAAAEAHLRLAPMLRTKRLGPIAIRSLWETREGVWYDVKVWFAVTALVALLSAWRGLPWRSYTILTVLALVAVLAVVLLWNFTGNVKHPDQNKLWAVGDTHVVTDLSPPSFI